MNTKRTWRMLVLIHTVDVAQNRIALWSSGMESASIITPRGLLNNELHLSNGFIGIVAWEQRHETDFAALDWLGFEPLLGAGGQVVDDETSEEE